MGYPKHFKSKVTDAISENFETQHWLISANQEGYIDELTLEKYIDATNEVGRLIHHMRRNPKQYIGENSLES